MDLTTDERIGEISSAAGDLDISLVVEDGNEHF